MLWLFAAVDILCALSLVLLIIGFPLYTFQAGGALLLMFKAVVFLADILSIFDIIAAVCMVFLIWVNAPSLAIGVALYLGIKGIYSMA